MAALPPLTDNEVLEIVTLATETTTEGIDVRVPHDRYRRVGYETTAITVYRKLCDAFPHDNDKELKRKRTIVLTDTTLAEWGALHDVRPATQEEGNTPTEDYEALCADVFDTFVGACEAEHGRQVVFNAIDLLVHSWLQANIGTLGEDYIAFPKEEEKAVALTAPFVDDHPVPYEEEPQPTDLWLHHWGAHAQLKQRAAQSGKDVTFNLTAGTRNGDPTWTAELLIDLVPITIARCRQKRWAKECAARKAWTVIDWSQFDSDEDDMDF